MHFWKKRIKKDSWLVHLIKCPFQWLALVPLGVSTHKSTGKKHLIVDLSASHNKEAQASKVSVFWHLSPCFTLLLRYAIKFIKKAGRGAWLAKADITDSYKVMPWHPLQWHLFGVKWRDKMYFTVRLTFGWRSSLKLFNILSEALCWILLNNCKLPFVLHLLDDFLLVDYPNSKPDRCICALKHTWQNWVFLCLKRKSQACLRL